MKYRLVSFLVYWFVRLLTLTVRLRVVGEDEADPTSGTVSHTSPLALILMGKSVGDTAFINGSEIEIVAIDP